MNKVIGEFTQELNRKIPHSYQIFLYDPTAMEWCWDPINRRLVKDTQIYDVPQYYFVSEGVNEVKKFMIENYKMYKSDLQYKLLLKIIETCDRHVEEMIQVKGKDLREKVKNTLLKQLEGLKDKYLKLY